MNELLTVIPIIVMIGLAGMLLDLSLLKIKNVLDENLSELKKLNSKDK